MTLEEQLSEVRTQLQSAQGELDAARDNLTQRDATLTQLQGRVAEQEQSLHDAEANLTQRTGELSQATARISHLEADLTTARQSLQSTTQELTDAKAKLSSPSREAASICASLATAPIPVAGEQAEPAASENPIAQYTALIHKGKPKEAAAFYEKHVRPILKTATR